MLQEDAEDREAVADKLASAKAWLADLRKQQKVLTVERDLLAAGASSSESVHWLAFMGTAYDRMIWAVRQYAYLFYTRASCKA